MGRGPSGIRAASPLQCPQEGSRGRSLWSRGPEAARYAGWWSTRKQGARCCTDPEHRDPRLTEQMYPPEGVGRSVWDDTPASRWLGMMEGGLGGWMEGGFGWRVGWMAAGLGG